jgi:predicted nucleotidyltransferase
MIDVVTRHLDEIAALCRQFGVRRLDLFGSAAAGAFDPATSDLDFVATFSDTAAPNYAERYLNFAEALEALFGRPVDVVIDRSIRNPHFRRAVEATRQPVYDDRNALAAA